MIEARSRSSLLWEQAQGLMPGGVNSPVRAFKAVGGEPIFFSRGYGAYLEDADGTIFCDFVGAWGPMILGHAHPAVVRAVQEAAARGLAFGAPTQAENDLAVAIRAAMPAVAKVRLVNSGTEAVMSALRLARAFTGRTRVIKFIGCYHGHADSLLVKAGSGVATLGLPDSPGVPEEIARTTLPLPFNDPAAVTAAFAAHRGEIAAVILEPVVGNAGVIAPAPGYLEHLRKTCTDAGALLIFDEVMTGFRVARGGAQARYGIRPDLTCLAKIVGGGVPCGAYGGSADLMSLIAPQGPVYQAGTMSGNPLATAAGLATLAELSRPGVYERLEALGMALEEGLGQAAADAGVPLTIGRVGSMLTAFFTTRPVVDWETARLADTARFARFHAAMLAQQVYLPPSQYEAWFLSTAHTEADISRTVEAARRAMRQA